jgi:hypothetical protein
LKNKECRTRKVNMIFELTNSFKYNYNLIIEKTQIQNVLESCVVDNSYEISNISFTPKDLIDTHNLVTLIMND